MKQLLQSDVRNKDVRNKDVCERFGHLDPCPSHWFSGASRESYTQRLRPKHDYAPDVIIETSFIPSAKQNQPLRARNRGNLWPPPAPC